MAAASASICSVVACVLLAAALAAISRNGSAVNEVSDPAPSVTEPLPLRSATTPGGLNPSPETSKDRSKGPVARGRPATASVSPSRLPCFNSALAVRAAPLPRGESEPDPANAPPNNCPSMDSTARVPPATLASSLPFETGKGSPSDSVLALREIVPSVSSRRPSANPRAGQYGAASPSTEPSMSSVDAVRSHATNSPIRAGREIRSAVAAMSNLVTAPVRSKCAEPSIGSSMTVALICSRSIVPAWRATLALIESGTPCELGGGSSSNSGKARLASSVETDAKPLNVVPSSLSAPMPSNSNFNAAVSSAPRPDNFWLGTPATFTDSVPCSPAASASLSCGNSGNTRTSSACGLSPVTLPATSISASFGAESVPLALATSAKSEPPTWPLNWSEASVIAPSRVATSAACRSNGASAGKCSDFTTASLKPRMPASARKLSVLNA